MPRPPKSKSSGSNPASSKKAEPLGDTRLTLRIDFPELGRLGPGKIRLLELVGEKGSISAAGRAMGMSYRRAWQLIDELNKTFRDNVVETQQGGVSGGGAVLTQSGRDVIRAYRAIEAKARIASAAHIEALARALAH
ncbi:MAG: winged helix-turn-helix domain-containing protein [Parvibaculum sp.]|uniref:winged helix-turn-helix domain-containing protein n=1 Tax=Parvibaculum sp. TaxID=2024848 RepID=UPI0025FBA7E7|nr:winged helix-turn-helix domain-containing protein [Parvibaculum sp.]MCE9650345.1 winged helix-turn-helix domain-containing protein [Parvibaculum sp.]